MKLSKAWPLAASLGVMPPVHFSENPSAEKAAEISADKKVYQAPEYEKHEAINCGADSEWWRARQALNLIRDSRWEIYSALKDSNGDIVPESRFEAIVGDQKSLEAKKGEETVVFTMVLIDGSTNRSKWTLMGEVGQYGRCAAYLRETSPGEATKTVKAIKVVNADDTVDYFNGGASCEQFKKAEGVECSTVQLNLSDDVTNGRDDDAEVAIGWALPSEAEYHATYVNVCAGNTPINNPKHLIYPDQESGLELPKGTEPPSIGEQVCDDLVLKARASLREMGLEPFMTQADLD